MNSIILQNTTQSELKALISETIKEALQDLAAEPKPSPENSKLTRQQVKEEFHISFPTILKLEKQGKLKGYRIGRRVIFNRVDVEAALIQRKF
jgi:excisionase family DNA binding protein